MQRVRAAMLTGLVLCVPAGVRAATDLPPAGRSLFDHLTSRTVDGRSVQRIPYPFAALLDEIEQHAGTDALGRPGIAAVLIPLGRSLQRNASAGDYFRHPRVVVAITGETRAQEPPRLMLKDRLFLGFQDEAGVIEVISYNEHAGRFEFQVVSGYRAGETPRVQYARRAVCAACHHAAAPIFSRPGWDETNANPAVARALSVHAASFHGVQVKRGVDVPNAIDDAVVRANRMAIAQTVWRAGCDAVRAPDGSIRGQIPDGKLRGQTVDGKLGGQTSGETLREQISDGHPRGQVLSDPVACREALLTAALERRLEGGRADAAAASRARLAPLLASWRALWPQGLAEPDPNIPNRDPFFGRAQQLGVTSPNAPWGAEEVVPALDPMATRKPVDAWRADARGVEALLHTLGSFFAAADVRAIEHALVAARRAHSQPAPPKKGSEQDSVPSWQGGHDATGSRRGGSKPPHTGPAELPATLASAVATLAAETRAGRTDVLASAAFRRAALLRELARALGTNAQIDCCDEASPAMTPAVLEAGQAAPPAAIPQPLRPFYAHCSACHDMPTASPPGFLHGPIAAVERHIGRCAARIRFRLSMWQAAPAARAKTPMPPPVFVPAWEHAAPRSDIERMLDYVTQAMPANAAGGPPAGGYETLPPCRYSDPAPNAMRAR